MRAEQVRGRAALLTLLLVAAGLFLMHTLGHTTPAHAVDQAVGTHHHLALQVHDHPPGMPMGPVELCVAVLCGLTVVAIAGLLAGLWRIPPDGLNPPRRVRTDPGRGPPVLIGLLLADLAVWRN